LWCCYCRVVCCVVLVVCLCVRPVLFLQERSRSHKHTRTHASGAGQRAGTGTLGARPLGLLVGASRPLQDMVSCQGFCARVNYPNIPPRPALPTRLQYCWTTIAQHTTPPPPSFECHTSYNIGSGNLVLRPRASRRRHYDRIHTFCDRIHTIVCGARFISES